MKPLTTGLAIVLGMSGMAVVAASQPETSAHARIEASELAANPSNWWACKIEFADVLESPLARKTRKLDHARYHEMKLQTAGTVWVPAAAAPAFEPLKQGAACDFAGTVDQFDGQFYVVVDAVSFSSGAGEGTDAERTVSPEPAASEPKPPEQAQDDEIAKRDAQEKKAAEKQARLEAKRRAAEEKKSAKAVAKAERERIQAETRAREEAETQAKALVETAEAEAHAEEQAKLDAQKKKTAEKQARLEAKRRAAEEKKASKA